MLDGVAGGGGLQRVRQGAGVTGSGQEDVGAAAGGDGTETRVQVYVSSGFGPLSGHGHPNYF